MNQSFPHKINSKDFEINGIVDEVIYGNQYTDSYNGIKEFGYTTLKLRCHGFTLMIFKKDIKLFDNVSIGDTINAIVKPN